ncbi:hypothetical protein BD779DRAFT_948038 [Infundibulicybe gibba]|nr:hypothetical protein BD779DRAFT_948038 [Infundibulicybe gibba]
MQNWAGQNENTGTLHYSTNIEPKILEKLADAKHVSFGDANEYMVKLNATGSWYGDVNNPAVLGPLRLSGSNSPTSTRVWKVSSLGTGKTHFYALTHGFSFHFDDEVERDPQHPLTKVIREFASNGSWRILKSSALCPWDPQYFFLNFQQEGSTIIQRRWNLPPEMNQKLKELKDLSETPEEQNALVTHEQDQMQYFDKTAPVNY